MAKRPAPKAKAKSRPAIPMLDTPKVAAPAWVTEMHQHFSVKGGFRAEDIRRVLGDPREGVQFEVAAGSLLAAVRK